MGKTIKESVSEIEKCINQIKYFNENTFEFLKPEQLNSKKF